MEFKITINGYGGELTIGSVDQQTKDLLASSRENLPDAIQNGLVDWKSMDDQYHIFAPGETFLIQVEDESGQTVFEIESEELDKYDNESFSLAHYQYPTIDNSKDLVMCISFQKGVLFEGYLQAEEFEIQKLKLLIDGEVGISSFVWGDMLRSVEYDGVTIENIGTLTDEVEFQAHLGF